MIKRDKINNYYWSSASIDGKSVVITFYEYYPRQRDVEYGIVREFEVGLGVGNNRNQILNWLFKGNHFLQNKITGNGSIKYLIWAKNQLLEFEDFIKEKYPVGKIKINIGALDNKRYKVYKKGLHKYGYEEVSCLSKILEKII